ncbi:MAG TPA: tRNA (N6-isopentenyl adenosine(37)-C2)-methylthiotransferase MiaB [Acholeplasmataceae bacterium]|nr:tRNA (N6-isopentenyl adenosine(37)-C2)-methylthiotransferase MiaB [Acholeplasmataceae bacterium]
MKDYSKYFAPSLKDARKRLSKETQNLQYQIDEKLIGIGNDKTYIIKTYGCQGNLADSEKIAGIMDVLGFTEVDTEEEADVIILNTCAIRDNAEKRVFGELGRLKGLKVFDPNKLFVVCGCMPQEEGTVNKIKDQYNQVDIVFGTHNIHKLPEYLNEAYLYKERILEVFSYEGDIVENIPQKRAHEYSAWVNIMYGCDEFCTYCIVPYTRGKERSRRPQDIIDEIKELAREGYKEVTLLGQNVNAYGKDFTDINYTFANLLSDLQKTDIERIRFTTSHPRDLDDETIKVMATGKNIMPHLHLPVQSGSNRILKAMNRKYTKESYLEKIQKLRSLIPDISITTDIIVGFPGETEEDFLETLRLVEEANFEGAFTFIFSPREGTPASKFSDETPLAEKKDRLLRLNKIVNEGYARGNKRFVSDVVKVLVTSVSNKNDKVLSGYTPHFKLVNFEGSKDLIGKIVDVKVEKAYTWHLKGVIV